MSRQRAALRQVPDDATFRHVVARRHRGREPGQAQRESAGRHDELARFRALDPPGQRCPHLLALGREDVEAEVDRRGLVGGQLARRVEARLAVRTDRAGRRERIERDGREIGLPLPARCPGAATSRRARAARGPTRPARRRAGRPPPRAWWHARRGLADRPVPRTHALGVVVVRLEHRLLLRADGDDRGARGDQMRDGFQLGVLERAGGVEAAHDLGGGRDRVVQVMSVRDSPRRPRARTRAACA